MYISEEFLLQLLNALFEKKKNQVVISIVYNKELTEFRTKT